MEAWAFTARWFQNFTGLGAVFKGDLGFFFEFFKGIQLAEYQHGAFQLKKSLCR